MTDFEDLKQGDRVRATLNESVIVGTIEYTYRNTDEVDVAVDGAADDDNAITLSSVWDFEVIKPPRPLAQDLPLGSLVKADGDSMPLIKIAGDAWVLYGGAFRVGEVPTYRNQYVDENGYEEVASE